MTNKLTDLLCAMNVYERNRFEKYLHSPFFNDSEVLCRLFERLSTEIKKNGKVLSSKQVLWQLFAKGKPYNDLKFRRWCSDLNRLATDFLTYLQYERQPVRKGLFTVEAVQERKITKHYGWAHKTVRRELSNESYHYAGRYLHEYQLAQLGGFSEEGREGEIGALRQVCEPLDLFYVAEKLRYYCALLNYKNIAKLEYDMPLAKELMDYLEKNPPENEPQAAIYYQIALTFEQPDVEKHFFRLKKLWQKHGIALPRGLRYETYGYAQNYCIRKINAGGAGYLNELFDLYKIAISEALLLDESGELSPWHYKNIVAAGLRLKRYDWVSHFMEQNRLLLPASQRENAYVYNKAKWFFAQKNYGKTMELLQEVRYDDVFYGLDARAMLLKTYYELGEEEPFYALTHSFAVFLQRKKGLSEQHRKNYLAFIAFIKKLHTLDARDASALAEFKKRVNDTRQLADRKWLMEKLNDF